MIATRTTAADYQRVFEVERQQVYPVIDAFEATCGFALDRAKLEAAARVLACPIKKSAPHWQHGRVIYAAARRRLVAHPGPVMLLDIGSAKGFSALCLQWAADDADAAAAVVSLDVIDPAGKVYRNTVAEQDGPLTLAETLAAWPESMRVEFRQSTGVAWLTEHDSPIAVALVDGKHSFEIVKKEGALLAKRQWAGDVAIFDDIHIAGVANAVTQLQDRYDFEYLRPLPNRAYAVGVRK
jgi:hypothetical protein